MTEKDLIEFEESIRALWRAGELPCLLHLCGGNERQLLEIFQGINPAAGDWVVSTHRNHYHALLAGIAPEVLRESIKAGRSMFTYSRAHNFLSTAILAGGCGIAAGLALALKEAESRKPKAESQSRSPHVWCFLGDGAEEEGHFYEAVLFVEAQGLPCTFIIEDNDRQVDTAKDARRGRSCAARYPLDHFPCVRRYHYTPTWPHAGDGSPAGSIVFQPAAIERMKNIS